MKSVPNSFIISLLKQIASFDFNWSYNCSDGFDRWIFLVTFKRHDVALTKFCFLRLDPNFEIFDDHIGVLYKMYILRKYPQSTRIDF